MRSPLTDPLRPLEDAWRVTVRAPRRRLVAALLGAVVVAALLVARHGTGRARLAAGGMVLGALLLAAAVAWMERRSWDDPARVVRRLALAVDRERAERALRALTLIGPSGDVKEDGTSPALARLHVSRAIAALPAERIFARASRVGRALRYASLAVMAAGAVVTLALGWKVLEGADVLVARHGRAPLEMTWLEEVDVRARPPDYLHLDEREIDDRGLVALPHGTLITFRGMPLHAGRRLFLTDGASEIPFVDDGADRMVARWPLEGSASLRVVARFGEVVIEEPTVIDVRSIADEAPVVTLEGAPKEIDLAAVTEEDDGEIPIRYEATDDHGLREVHLVLRAGTREERRVLSRLDGETRYDRGGHMLRARDPFIKKSHAPVEVRVEAKDNDPLTGPKWGASEAFILVPPDVGAPEARRLDALRKLRDAFVDLLAWRLAHPMPADSLSKHALMSEEMKKEDEAAELTETTLAATYAGVRVPLRLQAMVRGKLRQVKQAVDTEVRGPTGATHDKAVGATETFVLVVDAIVRGLGTRDTRDAARQLAEVADDLALGASLADRGTERERAAARMDAATHVLQGGSRAMLRLGGLGRDIGEIVDADLARVVRARGTSDFAHAELAARDLATRLREPDPSFGSQGRSGRGGGESGGGRGTPGDDGTEPDEAEQAFNQAAQDLERIAQDHAGEIGDVEQDLNGAATEDEMKQLRDEAKKHADAIREATKDLPSVGGGSDSWTSKGAAGKELAEQMAQSLERGDPSDAVQSGKNALGALDEAKKVAQRDRYFGQHDEAGEREIEDAKSKLEKEEQWAEQALDALRKKAAERASGKLAQRGDEEGKLAERMQELGEKGRDQGGMPQPAIESIDDAEKAARAAEDALKRGDVDKALEDQREAQRKLEMAKEALGNGQGDDGKSGDEGDEGNPAMDHADIPRADAHKGPEDFRRRVMQGLGQPSGGRLKDAVRRYAEGLLR